MSAEIEFKPEVLWHGPHLDGTLTVQTSEHPTLLHFYLKAFDTDAVGHIDVTEVMHDPELMVTRVLETIDHMYLENTVANIKEQVANGEAKYQ